MISCRQILSNDFILEFSEKLNWRWISEYQYINENTIKKCCDKIYWDYLCCNSKIKLNENIIRIFKDKVDWWKFHIDKF